MYAGRTDAVEPLQVCAHTSSPAYPPKRGFGYMLQAGCSSKEVSFPEGC